MAYQIQHEMDKSKHDLQLAHSIAIMLPIPEEDICVTSQVQVYRKLC